MSAQGLPINLLAQFVPRPPAEFEKPIRAHKPTIPGPMSHLVELFETDPPPTREPFESPLERKNRIATERKTFHEQELELLKQQYKPSDDPHVVSDPYRTLFVGRLAYETTERTLKRVFDEWGRIKSIRIICDKEGKSRGYGFIEYEDERDLKDAYKHADGIKIDGRGVLVDVERGRTVPDWLPRRLGLGKGPGQVGFNPKQKKSAKPFTSKRPRDDSRHYHHRDDRDQRYDRDNRSYKRY